MWPYPNRAHFFLNGQSGELLQPINQEKWWCPPLKQQNNELVMDHEWRSFSERETAGLQWATISIDVGFIILGFCFFLADSWQIDIYSIISTDSSQTFHNIVFPKQIWKMNEHDYPLVNKHFDPENHSFLLKTSLPTPITARVVMRIHQRVIHWKKCWL